MFQFVEVNIAPRAHTKISTTKLNLTEVYDTKRKYHRQEERFQCQRGNFHTIKITNEMNLLIFPAPSGPYLSSISWREGGTLEVKQTGAVMSGSS